VDQRPDDGRSLTFDGEPLNDRLEILGAPVLTLDIAADKPNAIVAVRLNDVAPDGTSAEVTYGLLNLTHRGGHETPLPLEPGAFYRVKVQVNDIAYAFPKGHRVRVAISTSYWPIAWPSPEISIITVRCGVSTLELPVRPPRQEDAALRPFEEPESAPTTEHKKLRQLPLRRVVEFDLTNSEATYTVHSDGGEFDGASLARIETIGMDLGYSLLRRHRISDTDPLSAQTEFEQRAIMRRADWSVRIESRTRLTATRDTFQFSADVEAFEGDDTFAKRKWQLTIPRNMV